MSLILLRFLLNPHCFFLPPPPTSLACTQTHTHPTLSYSKKLGLVCLHEIELLGSPKPLCYLNGTEFLGILRENLFELDCILSHSYTGLNKVILNKSCIPSNSKINTFSIYPNGRKKDKKRGN